jgi:hypothetical protein
MAALDPLTTFQAGSVPHAASKRACQLAFEHFFDVPAWPPSPRRAPLLTPTCGLGPLSERGMNQTAGVAQAMQERYK